MSTVHVNPNCLLLVRSGEQSIGAITVPTGRDWLLAKYGEEAKGKLREWGVDLLKELRIVFFESERVVKLDWKGKEYAIIEVDDVALIEESGK